MAVIIWLNGPFGVGKTTTAEALLRRLPRAVLFDPEPFGTALRHTVANIITALDFQDVPGWQALVIEIARILREAYAETLIVPLTVLKNVSAEALAARLVTVDPDVRRYRLTASEATLRARILKRPETEGPHAWCLDHLEAGQLLMANAAFGEAVPTDGRDPEHVADYILARLRVVRRTATDADRAFARDTHHLAYRELVERQFGPWVDKQQDSLFESSWEAMPHEIILFGGEPCGYLCVEDRPSDVHLRELVLLPSYQGRGIGSSVLDSVIERARARRVPVRLRTNLANRAANLYRRVGFRQIGTTEARVGWWDLRGRDFPPREVVLIAYPRTEGAAHFCLCPGFVRGVLSGVSHLLWSSPVSPPLLLALGLFAPLGAVAIAAAMLVAVGIHWRKGPMAVKGG